MAVGATHVFPGFLTPVLTQLFFPKPPTTFPTCFCRGERRKYAAKKVRLNQGSNSQPPGHESDALTTEPPGRSIPHKNSFENIMRKSRKSTFSSSPIMYSKTVLTIGAAFNLPSANAFSFVVNCVVG